MRVFICVDMEGVAGIATLDQVVRGGTGYPRAQELMTLETNAAVAGAFAGGADAVLVCDSHGTMDNLLHERLDRRARLVFGAPRASCMVQGLTAADDVALFVGQHAAAGTHGVLAHTFSSTGFTDVRVNGVSMTESEVNALFASAHGVPIGLVTGDDHVCAVAEKAFGGVRVAAVKQAVGYAAADSLHPAEARELIEAQACAAVANAEELVVPPVPGELVVEIDFTSPFAAEFAASPGSERTTGRSLRREVTSAGDALAWISSCYYASALATAQFAALAARR